MHVHHGPARTAIAWLLLTLTVGGYIALQRMSLSPMEADHDRTMQHMLLKLNARYLIGVQQFLPIGEVMPVGQLLGPAMDDGALALRTVPVIAEVAGARRALRAIEQLTPRFDDDDVQRDLRILRDAYTRGSAALSDAERAHLRELEWFGELALTHDLASSDPHRRAALAPARRTAAAYMVFGIGALLAGIAGLVLFVLATVQLCTHRLRLRYRESVPASAAVPPTFVETLTVFLLLLLLLGVAAGVIDALTGVDVRSLWLWAAAAALLWPVMWGMPWRAVAPAIGWHRGAGALREVGAGIVGYLAGLPVLLVGLILTVIFALLNQHTPYHPGAFDMFEGGTWSVISMVILACIWAPVLEELVFRGFFHSYLRQRLAAPYAGIIGGLIFAAIHPQGWMAIPVLAALGFNFAMIREWRGSIIAPITAHALHNSAAVGFVIFAIL